MDPEQIPLRDLHLPEAVGWWPLAPGWWLLIGCVAILLALYLRKAWQRWRDDRPRRIALEELARLEDAWRQAPDAVLLATRLSELLRRTMLAYARRSDVAGLTGAAWLEWLDRGLEEPLFSQGPGRSLSDLPYRRRGDAAHEIDVTGLIGAVRRRLKAPLPEAHLMWSFAWPWMFLALPLPLLVRALAKPADAAEAGLKVPSLASFAVLGERRRVEQLRNWRAWAAIVAWALLVTAAARPEYLGDEIDVPVSGRNLMLAVDLSGSMDAKDFELANRRVDRLTATKAVASDFIRRREGDRLGLILFGERAYLQVPLTLDRDTVNVLLMEAFIGLAGEKTAIGDAITLAVKLIHDQSGDAGEQVLILLTDGANTAGAIEPVKAAELAQQIGLRIHTIGIGAEQMVVPSITGALRRVNPSADLDEETLTRIAALTGGHYFRATDTDSLQQIYRLLDEMEPVAEPEGGFRPIRALYYWPLGGAFVLAFLLGGASALSGMTLPRTRTSAHAD